MPKVNATTGLLACLVLLLGVGVAMQGVFLWRLNQHIESMFAESSNVEDVLASLVDGLLGEPPGTIKPPRIGEKPEDEPPDRNSQPVEPSASELLDQLLSDENLDENVRAMIDALGEILSDPALQ